MVRLCFRLNNTEIAKQVGYGGFRSVQLANISAKNMILNIAKGVFHKKYDLELSLL